MKYLLGFAFFVVLITSISLKQNHQALLQTHQAFPQIHETVAQTHQGLDQAHQGVVQNHQGITENHENTQANHQFVPALSAGLGIANAAIDLGKSIAAMFPVTCSGTGYKRGNKITIQNGLYQGIRISGMYTDSGKIYEKERGEIDLPPGEATTWQFVKKGGAATGSNGVITVDLPTKTLVIFYQNPWSAFNFAGICIEDKMEEYPTNKQLKAVYKRLYKYKQWPDNCKMVDNRKRKDQYFKRTMELNRDSYYVAANVLYEKVQLGGANTCYTQYISVVVCQ